MYTGTPLKWNHSDQQTSPFNGGIKMGQEKCPLYIGVLRSVQLINGTTIYVHVHV